MQEPSSETALQFALPPVLSQENRRHHEYRTHSLLQVAHTLLPSPPLLRIPLQPVSLQMRQFYLRVTVGLSYLHGMSVPTPTNQSGMVPAAPRFICSPARTRLLPIPPNNAMRGLPNVSTTADRRISLFFFTCAYNCLLSQLLKYLEVAPVDQCLND